MNGLLSLPEQAVLVTAALVLFTAFALLAQTRLLAATHAFAWQGALLALLTLLVAWTDRAPHLYFSAALTLALKALLIPWMLHRLIRRLRLDRHVAAEHSSPTLFAAAALTLFSYWLVLPIVASELAFTRNVLAIGLALVLIGLLTLVARQQAVMQVLGFMAMENGLFLAAVSATHGMPLIVELGVAFDVLVAAVLFGVFFFQIRDRIETLDIDRLNRLVESASDERAGEDP